MLLGQGESMLLSPSLQMPPSMLLSNRRDQVSKNRLSNPVARVKKEYDNLQLLQGLGMHQEEGVLLQVGR